MDNTSIYDVNVFPSSPTVGSDSASYPTEMSGLNNPGAAPQLPWTIGSGVTRGDQTIGGTQTIANPDGSKIVIGAVPNSTTNQYGITLLDSKGNIIQEIISGTNYFYDSLNGFVNSIIFGTLPDGSNGLVIAKPGIAATSLFS